MGNASYRYAEDKYRWSLLGSIMIGWCGHHLRRSGGTIFGACRSLRFCSPALDSKINGCMEGAKLTLDLSQESILEETNCLELV
jgi:hypothetical protein